MIGFILFQIGVKASESSMNHKTEFEVNATEDLLPSEDDLQSNRLNKELSLTDECTVVLQSTIPGSARSPCSISR